MARPSKFTDDDMLDAARDAVHRHGAAVTIGQIAGLAGAPVGSVYHRFGSRDELMVRLWLRGIRRFQSGLLELDATWPSPRTTLVRAALWVPNFCRSQPAEANVLTLYRQQVLAEKAPELLRDEVRHLNDNVFDLFGRLARRLYGESTEHGLDVVRTACQQSPYGLVRPYVGRRGQVSELPLWLDDAIEASTEAILDLPLDGEVTN